MGFSDEQYIEAISNNSNVKKAYDEIQISCQRLKEDTNCPDEDIDEFLRFMIGKWNK
tara:strand:+ start:155 stop:325 length:171 start_codon:yes stop_codon:yes gene_type:complete